MHEPPSLISVVDDDASFRDSMRRLLKSHGYAVAVFPSAAEFLASAQGVDIDRQHLDRHRIELALPGRHHPGMGVGDARHHLARLAAIEPHPVGQVGRADRAIAGALRTVADRKDPNNLELLPLCSRP